jgi:hypothetical protein
MYMSVGPHEMFMITMWVTVVNIFQRKEIII